MLNTQLTGQRQADDGVPPGSYLFGTHGLKHLLQLHPQLLDVIHQDAGLSREREQQTLLLAMAVTAGLSGFLQADCQARGKQRGWQGSASDVHSFRLSKSPTEQVALAVAEHLSCGGC